MLNKSGKNPLHVFWSLNVPHFGMVDVPAFGVSYEQISEVYKALRVRQRAIIFTE